jgi:type IV pilus assembly protein PilM
MAGEKAVWGIDIGQCALKALKLQLEADEVEAVAFDIVEHPKPLSQGERGGQDLIAQALETLVGRNAMAGQPVVIGVPGQQAFTRFTKLPPVEPKQLPAIVQFEAGQQIPYDINEVIWDYQVFRDDQTPDVEVGIFCMRKELLDRYLTPFTDAGLQPIIVQPAPLALYNFLDHDGQRSEKATILLDIGSESTDLIVAHRGTVWTRPVPIGGSNFTESLVKAFKLQFPKAENLKRTAATSKYARQVFQAMRPVYQDLVSEIQRSIGFYSSTHRDAELDKIVGMGNGFRLPGLQKFLQQNLNMKVERVSAFNNLRPGASLNAPTLNENVLSLGVAYGLAVQGLGRSKITTNLLPPQIAKQAVWGRKRPWFAAAVACLVLAAASLWARYFMDASALARNIGSGPVEVPQFRNREQAVTTLQKLSNDVPPRVYTATVLGCAQYFASEWRKLDTQVKGDSEKVKPYLSLLADQALWPKILDLINQAVLSVADEKTKTLLDAPSLQAYKAEIKNIPRKDRRQIFIEKFDAKFSTDVAGEMGPLMAEEEPPGAGGAAGTRGPRHGGLTGGGTPPTPSATGGAAGATGGSSEGQGFVITLIGYTPNAKHEILTDFANALKERGNPADPKEAERLGFYVMMPHKPIEGLRYRYPEAATRVEEPSATLDQTEPADANDYRHDPVTGEWVAKDWVFSLTFGVVRGKNPAAAREVAKPGGARRSPS